MAEPTFVAASTVDGGTDGTQSGSYDVGSGTDRTLYIGIHVYDESFTDPITVSTCTYNGVSLTERKVTEHQFAGGGRTVKTFQYTLDNPASGSNTWVVTLSEGGDLFLVTLGNYTGANNGVGANTASTGGNITDHEYDITGVNADGVHMQAGAVAGEYCVWSSMDRAMRTGFWSFIGKLQAMFIKYALALLILALFIYRSWP